MLSVLLSLVLLGGACAGSKHKGADDASPGDTTVPTTVPADPWLTEVATAAVPEVQVHLTKPADAGGSDVSAQGVSYRGATAAPIPRAGLSSAGSRVTSDGFAFSNPTYFGNPLVFRVTEDDGGDWLKVQVLARPNGQEGWIKRSDVTLGSTRTHLELQKSTFHLKAYDGDKLLAETDVVIGKDASPTPVGTFYLTEKISRPAGGAYGPWIMATSAYSESLDLFDGGLPQVAFHGTNHPSLIGTQASNGCVRMPDDVDQTLAYDLPPGTPITITP